MPWHEPKIAPLIPIAIICCTIIFFAADVDSLSAGIKWNGIGKYINYAFRFFAIDGAMLFLIGYYKKKYAWLMRPILYVLGFGIIFGCTTAICFYFGLDITGNTSDTMNNGTHIEILTNSTTSAPNIKVSTTENHSNIHETTKERTSSVYGLCITRTVICLVLWIFCYFKYTDKVKETNTRKSDLN